MTVSSERTVERTAEAGPYRGFHVEVLRTLRLSPSFVRVTFGGEDLAEFADNGFDQRIKVILPLPGGVFAPLGDDADWYQRWRALPQELRNPIRTYTVRAVRPELRELDVDFVLHGESSPASRWATHASPRDRIVVIGPNAAFPGPSGGQEWAPPADAEHLLLAGDETAVPAIAAIAESLSGDVPATVLLEVPEAADALPLAVRPGVRVTWLPRGGGGHGDLLVPAVRAALGRVGVPGDGGPSAPAGAAALEDVDVDAEILWEVPEGSGGAGLYAWLAGEAGMVKLLRRHLVQEAGVPRSSVAFMGYWRLGRSETA
ncbi:NADPH-dependent ferric siderophore reductase [Streptosporangium becharense]|uniref:NADPH-dependent ferric siderophore reductase n=1 Tax=Streptosporangium becharense TaxID=1816182 RepID=A0A7W9INA9_9ACTN|nr:siderophore-interacting protein [Streptosporangium becharense]MBB2914448.1 NADPH-dependent ferric siderophore reductase [Streptosporangium becharense]MBB5823520.1 NADPH-dependent ferric siderophore reductase [Streptosporangium becharense]